MLFEKNVARARKQLDSEQDKNRSIRRELDRMAQKLASLDAKYGSVIEEFEGEAVITQEDGQTTTVSAGDDLVKVSKECLHYSLISGWIDEIKDNVARLKYIFGIFLANIEAWRRK